MRPPASRPIPAPPHALAWGLALALGLLPAVAGAQAFRGPLQPRNVEPQGAPGRAPAALPGLQGRSAVPPIPADPSVSNLSPDESLFDAINRGDLTAAREAVARGANIDSRNVLGLTPIDSAVDQGRNDIVFYLLSVRGTARTGSGPPGGAPPPRPSAAQRRAAEAAARQAERAAAPAPRPAAAPANRLPRLWANDGGAPIPSVGFLGFDAGRPSAGAPREVRATRGRG